MRKKTIKTLAVLSLLFIVNINTHAVIGFVVEKLWGAAELIINKAKEVGAADMIKTVELLDQISCLQNEFDLNFELIEQQMGCGMKIKYATAVTNLISAKQAILDYYTNYKSEEKASEGSKAKIERINEYLEKAIEAMTDFNTMVSYDMMYELKKAVEIQRVEMIPTYTLSRY